MAPERQLQHTKMRRALEILRKWGRERRDQKLLQVLKTITNREAYALMARRGYRWEAQRWTKRKPTAPARRTAPVARPSAPARPAQRVARAASAPASKEKSPEQMTPEELTAWLKANAASVRARS